MNSNNLPLKTNFKKLSGLDAITGRSNFDIAESIILLLMSAFSKYECTFAMLCKTIVAKNIIRDRNYLPFTISSMDLFTFDANKIFGVNCDAGLLVTRIGKTSKNTCTVYDLTSNKKEREFGWIHDEFYSNIQYIDSSINISGKSMLNWRQGIKHDCSAVMELSIDDAGLFCNKLGKKYAFRIGEFIFPLIKSSDIKTFETNTPRKYVIIPQKHINADTERIKEQDSNIWKYLEEHEPYLSTRKSIIYKNAPRFAIFGIGDYSFAKYKIGISGFYKEPIFTLIHGDIPIMMDDTCYFLSFNNMKNALITLALLNSNECLSFLKSIAFLDSKRPFTKNVLQRIDLTKLCKFIDFNYVHDFIRTLSFKYDITKQDYDNYIVFINNIPSKTTP
jgi:hypothetical protein